MTTPDADRAGVRPAVRPVASGAGVVILVEAALIWATDAGHEGISVTTALLGLVHTLRGGFFDAA